MTAGQVVAAVGAGTHRITATAESKYSHTGVRYVYRLQEWVDQEWLTLGPEVATIMVLRAATAKLTGVSGPGDPTVYVYEKRADER